MSVCSISLAFAAGGALLTAPGISSDCSSPALHFAPTMPMPRLRSAIPTLIALLLLSFLPRPAGGQRFAREIERFTDRLNAWEEMDGGSRAGARGAWSAMDTLVLAALNGGVAPRGLDSLLATVPGYRGASEGEGFQSGRVAFYSQLPRETPTYFVAPVRLGGRTLLVGVYSLTSGEPGRMSVYAERSGRWRRIGGHDGENQVAPYFLPLADSVLGVVTMDSYEGGDHSRGWVKLWRLTPSGLRLVRAEPGSMLDPRVEATDSTVVIENDSLPPTVGGAHLGPRMSFRSTYRARGGRIVRETAEANPWVHVVERFYALAGRGERTRARALAADEATYRALRAVEPHAQREGGEIGAGEGWMEMYTDGGPITIESRRGADGRWRIVRVARGEHPSQP